MSNPIKITKTIAQVTALLVLAALVVPVPAAALSFSIPGITVSAGSIVRGSSDGRSSIGDRFGRDDHNNEQQDGNTTAPGEDGQDGQPGENGGTVVTGDESVSVEVTNNAPTNTQVNEGNSNGGTQAGDGGDGGRGSRGGSVRSGGTSTSVTSFNSVNGGFVLYIYPFR